MAPRQPQLTPVLDPKMFTAGDDPGDRVRPARYWRATQSTDREPFPKLTIRELERTAPR